MAGFRRITDTISGHGECVLLTQKCAFTLVRPVGSNARTKLAFGVVAFTSAFVVCRMTIGQRDYAI